MPGILRQSQDLYIIKFDYTSRSPVPDYRRAIDIAKDALSDDEGNCIHCTVRLVDTICYWHYESEDFFYTLKFEAWDGE